MEEPEDPAVEAFEYLPAEEQAAAFDALDADQQAYVIDDAAEDALELIEDLDEAGVGYTLVVDPITGPKLMSLMSLEGLVEEKRMFSGLRFLWQMLCRWQCDTALKILRM